MSFESQIIALVMLVVGVGFLALPLLRQSRASRASERERAGERLKLIAAYERALMTVRDLDEDYQVGKLSEAAYTNERAIWVERGALLLAKLEEMAANGTRSRSNNGAAKQFGDKQPTVKTTSVIADDPVESAIAAYVKARE